MKTNDFSKYAEKILAHRGRVLSWLNNVPPNPILMELYPSNMCSHKCPYCPNKNSNSNDFLTLEQMKNYILQFKNLGGRAIIFSGGGEPLANPSTKEALAYAASLGIENGLFSNASLLNSDDLIKTILNSCKFFRISLDAGNPELFNLTHGIKKIHFDKIIRNIKSLTSIKKQIGSKCLVGTGYLTGQKTTSMIDMESFILLSIELGVDFVQFRPYLGDTTNINESIDYLEKKYSNQIIILTSNQKFSLFSDPRRKYNKCHIANFIFTVGADANVYSCCHLSSAMELSLGNLENLSLKDIWINKDSVINKINVSKCIILCRGNAINETLEQVRQTNSVPRIKGHIVHKNFL